MTSISRHNATNAGRELDTGGDSNHVIIIVGISVTLVVVIAVVIFLLVIFIRTQRSAEITFDPNQQDITHVHATEQQFPGQYAGPMWTADFAHDSYQSPPEQGTISYQRGYQNLINAHDLGNCRPGNQPAYEGTEPIYVNHTKSSKKYIADNTPQYDYLRQTSGQSQSINSAVVPFASEYDYPAHHSPSVQLGRDYSRFNSSDSGSAYDYPRNKPAMPSEATYDYPRPGQRNSPETAYDYPRNNIAAEAEYDHPRGGGMAGAESTYDYPGNRAAVGDSSAPSSNQPIYANLSKAKESVYDRPPPTTINKKASVKGNRAQRNALPKFTSPFSR